MVYVSEISAVGDRDAYCFGGGFYPRSRIRSAALPGGGELDLVDVDPLPAESIDYHGRLRLPPGLAPAVGSTVICAFRSQIFVSRSRVAVVGGLSDGRPELLGVFDPRGNLLDDNGLPLGAGEAVARVRETWARYESKEIA
jgi:predicted amino acid racemase